MKISFFLIRMLLITLICCFPTTAQDYTQFSLPKGAKARLGKGTLGEIQFSPDGSRLAVSSSIGIWLYDAQTGKEVDLLVHRDGVSLFAFAYAPDGKTIAICSTNDMIVVTGRREARFPSSTSSVVQLRDVATGEKKTTLRLQTQRVDFIAYSPDGKTIATAGDRTDNTVQLWDAQTGERRGALEKHIGGGGISALMYSPDGKTIATAGDRTDNTVQLWDAQTGAHKTTLTGHTKRVIAIAYAPDGDMIASGSRDGTVRLWDVATGKHKATLKHASGLAALLPWYYVPVNSVAYSPDGNTVAAVGWDSKLRLWDTRTTKPKTTLLGHTGPVDAIVYSPDGKTIATARTWTDNTVQLWDAVTGEIKATLTGYTPVKTIAYSPDGKTITTSRDYRNNSLQLWDTRTMELKTTFTERTEGSLFSIVYAPDGDTIAAGNLDDGTVRLWNAKTGKHKATLTHANGLHPLLTDRGYDISSVAYSPDGRTIVTGGGYYNDEGTVYLWHARTGKRKTLYKGPDYVSALAYSPDGRTIATGNQNKKIQVWHPVTGEELKAISTGHRAGVESLVYSPDGNTIATTGGFQDNTVQLWDVITGKHKATLIGHTNTVSSVAYSPDGNTIASGSTDGTVLLWDATTEEHKATFTAHTDIASVVYSPDGNTIATRSTDGTVLLWEIKSTLVEE